MALLTYSLLMALYYFVGLRWEIYRLFRKFYSSMNMLRAKKSRGKKQQYIFSKATSEERKEEIKTILGVNEVREYERYHGLPDVPQR